MKKIGMMLFSLLLMLILLCSWVGITQWNTISAVVDAFRYSEEDIERQAEENRAELQQFLDENEEIVVRDLTEEEKTALNEGKLDASQAVSILTGQSTLDDEIQKPAASAPAAPPQAQQPAASGKTVDQQLSELIAKLYVCKNDFLNKLAGLETSISNEFYGLPQEQWTKENKTKIITKHIGEVGGWEKECDATVNGILTQMRTLLTDNGRDTAVVGKIEENYLTEKRLKKAYYMNIYTRDSKEEGGTVE